MFKHINRLNQKGDTIVEVLIAITVVALMMASVFALVNRTSQNAQTTKEQAQALKIAEAQIEQLKVTAISNAAVFGRTTSKAFCISGGAIVAVGGDVLPASSYPAQCTQNPGVQYNFGIVETAPNTFTATVSWNGIRGGVNQSQLVYKVFAP